MSVDREFWNVWRNAQVIEFDEPTGLNYCQYAESFAGWADELVALVLEEKKPEVTSIYVAMLRLLKKYFDWYSAVPKSHRVRVGERGHHCIFYVFQATYGRLRAAELDTMSVVSPQLFFEGKKGETSQVRALYMGEMEE